MLDWGAEMSFFVDYQPKSKLWRFKEHWYGDTGSYKQGRISANVQDMDGDGSTWSVLFDDAIIAAGEVGPYIDGTPCDDFHIAIQKVEEILIEKGYLVP